MAPAKGTKGAGNVRGLPLAKPEEKVDVFGTNPEVILPPEGFGGNNPLNLEVNMPLNWRPKLFGEW